ncbi:MAG TPA: ABC transporter permease [Gemmatimonadaceae bacterium]|nr:ABC transporter permease [Gemmatimonadaceae bacterium]
MNLSSWFFNITEGIGIAFDAIRQNRVRAALTILGVAVGVFVVVTLAAAVHGINASVAKDLESAGPTSFYIYRRPVSLATICDGTDETCPWRRNPPITLNEADRIAKLPEIAAVTTHIGAGAKFKYKDKQINQAGLDGYSAGWLAADGGDIVAGRDFTYAENLTGASVVVINDKMAERLFKESDPLDKSIDIEGKPFKVIGLYHNVGSFLGKPSSSTAGSDPKAIIPLQAGKRQLGFQLRRLDLTVKPHSWVSRDQAIDAVTALIRGQRGLRPSAPDNFAIITSDGLMAIYNGFFGVFFVIMIALSAVGLMVGGVGVVAIMMISVTERTREIGVRKALGATRRTILWQFLVEAATLTCIGATIGLTLGSAVAYLVNRFTPVPASTPPMAIVAALGVSAVTGIVFGMLPAARASRLDPVEALRYE